VDTRVGQNAMRCVKGVKKTIKGLGRRKTRGRKVESKVRVREFRGYPGVNVLKRGGQTCDEWNKPKRGMRNHDGVCLGKEKRVERKGTRGASTVPTSLRASAASG